ncbi:nuclear transport factor 2 family protein [Colletotrichum tofieldiae]|nr:nuclear transport factor 2 family protein [Colletotrichum tofieldiae]GKT81146.1 nuclear transport factor 2 family protein [Colletotrichum tofieldiae]
MYFEYFGKAAISLTASQFTYTYFSRICDHIKRLFVRNSTQLRLLIINILGVNRARVRRDIKSDISDAIGRLDIHWDGTGKIGRIDTNIK